MKNEHITPEQAGRWVSGLMETREAAQLEAHVAECPPCEVIVQHEAVAEMQLVQAVSTMAPSNVVSLTSRSTGRRVNRAMVVGAIALAASLALVFRLEVPKHRPRAMAQASSVEVTVIKPEVDVGLLMGVPRYEEGHVLPRAALTAQEPFPL